GVHSQGEHEDQSCQAGQGEGGTHRHHETDGQQQVGQEGDAGDQAGKAIVEDHEPQNGQEGVNEGGDAGGDGILAQRGGHGALGNRLGLERGGQGAGPENVDQVIYFLLGEAAGDLAVGADFRIDGRGGHDLSVQNDGQVPFHLAFFGTGAGNVLARQ